MITKKHAILRVEICVKRVFTPCIVLFRKEWDFYDVPEVRKRY